MTDIGRIHIARFASQVLEGNPLRDPTTRNLYIYLPPSYDTDAASRFPVVYLLTGFTGRGRMLLNDNAFTPNLAERMDTLIASGKIREMIVVMPDCFTRLGGSQYINSSATGRYEDYMVSEIVPFVDANFHTLATREARAVMGKSSGGYGALVHAMRHADVFSIAASHSGDCLFEYSALPEFPKTVRTLRGDVAGFIERFWATEKKGRDDVPTLNTIAMSACYSPDPEAAPLGFRLPFDLYTGELDEGIWARWLTHDPIRMVEHEPHKDALRSLSLLYLDAGIRDEYALDLGARTLAARLTSFDIPFVHEEFDDGHFHTSYRYNRSLELISAKVMSTE